MKKLVISVYIVLGLLMIVGTFFDYEITSYLFNKNSFFGLFMQQFIYIPTFLIAFISVILLAKPFIFGKKTYKSKTFLLYLIIYLILVGMFIGLFVYYRLWIVILITLLLTLISLFIVWFIPENDYYLYQRLAIMYISILVIGYALVFGIKAIWGRERFYLLEHPSDFSLWFIPKGYKPGTRYNAFPSGHVTASMMSMIFVYLSLYIKKFRKHFTFISILVIIYVILAALSRMVLGKHYLSDTIFSMILLFSLFLIMYNKLIIKK